MALIHYYLMVLPVLRVVVEFCCRIWERCSTDRCIGNEAYFKMRQVLTLGKEKPKVKKKSHKIKRKKTSLPRYEQYWPTHDANTIDIIKLYWANGVKGVGTNVKFYFPY